VQRLRRNRQRAEGVEMIEVYSWATPNGHKVHIMLEECGLPYRAVPVDIGRGDQFQADFLAISPNNKIPAIVDPDGPDGQPMSLFESGAILLYLAGKTGRFLPADTRGRYQVLQWLMFQMGSVGPMLGQAHHFRIYAPEKLPYAIDRYTNEARRIYGVMNRQLAGHRYIAGADYSIADIAIFPWLRSWKNQGIDWNEFPHLKGWFDEIAARPAVRRGVEVLAHLRKPVTDDKARGAVAVRQGTVPACSWACRWTTRTRSSTWRCSRPRTTSSWCAPPTGSTWCRANVGGCISPMPATGAGRWPSMSRCATP
jgi:GST-like protein